jgi:hypothetical protein
MESQPTSLSSPVKVLKSPTWEGRLTDFVTIFEQHRASIVFALSVHTSLGVDTANRVLAGVHQNVESTDEKLTMLLLFRTLDSPYEKELMKVIAAKGGAKACLSDDVALEELMVFQRSKKAASRGAKPSTSADRVALDQMKKEMKEDLGDSLRKNMEIFGRKLEVQKRQLLQEMEGVVGREGDRIISALAGPLDLIIDSVSSYLEDPRCRLFSAVRTCIPSGRRWYESFGFFGTLSTQ